MDLLGSVWGSSGPLLVSVASLLHALGSSLRTRGSHLTTLSRVLGRCRVAVVAFCFALGVSWEVLKTLRCALRSLVGDPGAPEQFLGELRGLCGCNQGQQRIAKMEQGSAPQEGTREDKDKNSLRGVTTLRDNPTMN